MKVVRIVLGIVLSLSVIMTASLFALSHSDDSNFRHQVSGKSLSQLLEAGREHYRNQELDSALLMFSVVADKYDERMSTTDKELCVFAFNDVGVIDAFSHLDYVSGYNNLAQGLDIAVENELKSPESVICLNIAELFMNYYRHFKTDAAADKIHEYSQRGFQKAYEAKNYSCMGGIVVNILSFDLNTPLQDYKELFNADVPNDRRNVAYARSLMEVAEIYQAGKYAEAREALNNAFKLMNSEWNPERYVVSLYDNIADTYIAEGDLASAETWLLKALSQAESLGNIDQQLNVLSSLATMNTPSSETYKIQYLEKINYVMSTGRPQMINELDFLRSLNKERKKATELSESRRTLMIWLGIGGALFAIVSAFTIIVARLNVKLRERNRVLYKLIRPREASANIISNGDIEAKTQPSSDKYSGQSLKDERIDEIYNQIERVFVDEDTICSQDFTLSKLAAMIGVNTTYVSRVINEKYGCSFSTLASDRRIKIACARMDDHVNYGNLTIEAISRSVGFASRNTFVNAFKKANGMTPSEYLKASREFADEAASGL